MFFDLYGAKIALFFSNDLMLLLMLVLMLVLLVEWVDLSGSLMCLLVAVEDLLNALSLCCIVSLAVICTGTAREKDREGGESRGGDGVGGNIIS